MTTSDWLVVAVAVVFIVSALADHWRWQRNAWRDAHDRLLESYRETVRAQAVDIRSLTRQRDLAVEDAARQAANDRGRIEALQRRRDSRGRYV